MGEFQTISTDIWSVHVPNDWQQRDCSSKHTIYFEAVDGTKGAYFSSWVFQNDSRNVREILESFRRVELRSLNQMQNSTWEQVDDCTSDAPTLTVLGADFLDRKASYRIVCHLLGRLPWVVRSTFHDYNCCDYEASKRFFQPIIESVRIHDEG